MALEVVTDPADCDICNGRHRRDHVLERVCESCLKEMGFEFGIQGKLMYETDARGRRYIDKIPDDPSVN